MHTSGILQLGNSSLDMLQALIKDNTDVYENTYTGRQSAMIPELQNIKLDVINKIISGISGMVEKWLPLSVQELGKKTQSKPPTAELWYFLNQDGMNAENTSWGFKFLEKKLITWKEIISGTGNPWATNSRGLRGHFFLMGYHDCTLQCTFTLGGCHMQPHWIFSVIQYDYLTVLILKFPRAHYKNESRKRTRGQRAQR